MTTAHFAVPKIRDYQQAKVFVQKLKVLPHIVEAQVDVAKGEVMITYHEQFISPKEIETLIAKNARDKSLPTLTSDEALQIYEHKSKIEEEEKNKNSG